MDRETFDHVSKISETIAYDIKSLSEQAIGALEHAVDDTSQHQASIVVARLLSLASYAHSMANMMEREVDTAYKYQLAIAGK